MLVAHKLTCKTIELELSQHHDRPFTTLLRKVFSSVLLTPMVRVEEQ